MHFRLGDYKEKQYFHKEDTAEKVESLLDFPNPFQDKWSFWNQHYLQRLLHFRFLF